MASGQSLMSADPFTSQQDRILGMIRDEFPDYHPLVSLARIAHCAHVEPQHQIRAHSIIAEYTERKFGTQQVDVNVGVDFGKLTVVYSDHEQDLPTIVDEREVKVIEHESDLALPAPEAMPVTVADSGGSEDVFEGPLEALFEEL